MSRLLCTTIVAVWALLLPRLAQGQSASTLLEQGIRAYSIREYDGGAWLLRRALNVQGGDGLTRAEATRGLMYLAATELARNQRDSALSAARRLMVIDPKYRPEDGTFPPQAVALLQEARRNAPSVGIRAVGDSEIRPGVDGFTVRLNATGPQEVSAAVTGPDGKIIRTLYQGTVRDSIDVRWNGLDIGGNPAAAGRYSVLVVPTARERRGSWTLRMPLEVSKPSIDTMALPPEPPDSLFRPERGDYRTAWRSLAPGVLAGLAIVIVPKLVASDDRPSNARLIVGGTVTAASIAAFFAHRPGRPIPENTEYNRNLRETWRRNAADVTRRNADRQRQARLVIHAGAPVLTVAEGGAP